MFTLKGKGYFSDKISIIYTFAFGFLGGAYLGSLLDFFNGDSYRQPYRFPFNKITIYWTPIFTVVLMIIYVISLVHSDEIPTKNRTLRFICTCFFAILLIIPFSMDWASIIDFIHDIKRWTGISAP